MINDVKDFFMSILVGMSELTFTIDSYTVSFLDLFIGISVLALVGIIVRGFIDESL